MALPVSIWAGLVFLIPVPRVSIVLLSAETLVDAQYRTLPSLLGRTAPWEVTAVNITQPSADRLLGEIVVRVRFRADSPPTCAVCGQAAPATIPARGAGDI